ncbi:uncharacterized protein EV420DRAFT_1474836 [Desarmillaria tabescens]|uniref:Uncharacterized protein n=1 Tax=Armillaria tabescens TaxID=1929756 RepID=A0AA39NI14_ARMTA|nr:uncharacterized protein EV420DRAFT_1474836 [Desarmillaria tabescens]KAK0466023.1 hypothetical protein EV420DRAFT_1474836 [Desarmillaria tabescens]
MTLISSFLKRVTGRQWTIHFFTVFFCSASDRVNACPAMTRIAMEKGRTSKRVSAREIQAQLHAIRAKKRLSEVTEASDASTEFRWAFYVRITKVVALVEVSVARTQWSRRSNCFHFCKGTRKKFKSRRHVGVHDIPNVFVEWSMRADWRAHSRHQVFDSVERRIPRLSLPKVQWGSHHTPTSACPTNNVVIGSKQCSVLLLRAKNMTYKTNDTAYNAESSIKTSRTGQYTPTLSITRVGASSGSVEGESGGGDDIEEDDDDDHWGPNCRGLCWDVGMGSQMFHRVTAMMHLCGVRSSHLSVKLVDITGTTISSLAYRRGTVASLSPQLKY